MALARLLEISDLKKAFESPEGERTPVIDVPAFSMAGGEQLALEGASGSGKTTLLNLIAGILRPDQGQIRIDGCDLGALSESERDEFRARNLSYVFQTFNLLQGYTALENVLLGMMFGPGPDPAYARLLLDRVGLSNRLGYKPRQLSVGQQQRVALARALANRPKLVLADEPTGNLDQRRAQEALALLREACRENGAALLMVSHDRSILRQFERVEQLSTLNRAGRSASPDRPAQESTR
ncbi:MAG TPA: ABC transporter ATP-binding protein [Planctomycetota bacterium]|jgi:putative ABC transport system ATP-binding protein|nr:ABC transporter ATP-binding protein [Planctomycetota bacterium]